MKKLIAIVITLALVMCFGAAAFADGNADITATISVAQHRTDLEPEFHALIAAFNELYPNITVEVETVGNGYSQPMAIRLAADEYPDVLEVRDSLSPADTWPDYFASLEDCNLPEMLFTDYYTVNGVQYGACEAAGYRMFMYNKPLWAEAGIEAVPTTWAEFLDCMEKLSALDGVIPMTSQYNTTWTQREWIDYYAVALHGQGWKDTWVETDTPFSDEKVIACLNEYKSLIDGGYVEEDLMSSDWDLQSADFAAGTIATYCAGSYAYATMVGYGMDPADIGFFAFPCADISDDGNTCASAAVDWAWGMNKNVVGTDKYEACCLLVNFLAQNYGKFTNQPSCVIGAECAVEPINEMLATGCTLVGESRLCDEFTAINKIAAINIGEVVQKYVIAEDPQSVIDSYNAIWASARAEVLG